jgi:two-component system response regulator HydG
MVILSNEEELSPQSLPAEIRPAGGAPGGLDNVGGVSLEQLEREAIRSTLKMTSGNREQAAKILGIGERTLYRKIKEYGLTE